VDIINPAAGDYLLAHCTPPDDLLRQLAAETREAFPEAAGMQVSHDEGQLLTMLTLWGSRTRPLVLTLASMRPARIR